MISPLFLTLALCFSLSDGITDSVADGSLPNKETQSKETQSVESTANNLSADTRYWAGSDMEKAKTEALHRKVPILLLIVRDDDPVSSSWSRQHLNDSAFLTALEKHGVPALACVPGPSGKIHSSLEEQSDSCPLDGCGNCKAHQGSTPLLENLTIPKLLPRIFSIDPATGEARAIPEDLPFRGSKALDSYLAGRTETTPPTRREYRFLLKHLDRAREYSGYEEFEKGCQELVAAKRYLSLFGQEMTGLWDQAYAPYRGRGIQMIRKAKHALKTNRMLGARLLTRVAKMMAGLPEGERARHLLSALQPREEKSDQEAKPVQDQNIPN
ncbi:MAG: hypothetical protein H2076_01090 [Planctomycetes bacterium]|nr:hypothetical protein [Planctomycetota bacterium]